MISSSPSSSPLRLFLMSVFFLGAFVHLMFYRLHDAIVLSSYPSSDFSSYDYDRPTIRESSSHYTREEEDDDDDESRPKQFKQKKNTFKKTKRWASSDGTRTRRDRHDSTSTTTATTSTSTSTTNTTSTQTPDSLICYVSQGHAKMRERFETRFNYATQNDNSYRLFFHSYDKKCDGCLYKPKTTPAEGRNIAVKAAVTSPDWAKCRYLVVFDDDAYLLHDDTPVPQEDANKKHNKDIPRHDDDATRNAWKDLHEMLLSINEESDESYPIMSPQTPFDFKFQESHHTYQSCIDEVFWIIRHDVVDFVYPFSNLAGKQNFWMTNVAMFYIMEECFPAGIWVDYRWKVHNPKHRYQTTTTGTDAASGGASSGGGRTYYNVTWQRETLTEMLDRDYGALGPWKLDRPGMGTWIKKKPTNATTTTTTGNNNTLLSHRCRVELSPPVGGIDPKCRVHSQERFQKWLSGEYIP